MGRSTRGKTAANRLRRTDTFVLLDRPSRLRSLPPLYVDLGYGADPSTTIETYRRLRPHADGWRVTGVEIDRERVLAARSHAVDTAVDFRLGGFEFTLPRGEQAGVVRAMNVLRQYDEAEHAPAVHALVNLLAPGGLLLEGTSSPTGRLLAMNVYERAIDRDAPNRPSSDRPAHRLVLSPNLRRPWTPLELRTVLPKNFIHHAGPTSRLDRLFTEWERAWHRSAGQPIGKGPAFERAALALVDAGYDVDQRRSLLRRGFLILRSVG